MCVATCSLTHAAFGRHIADERPTAGTDVTLVAAAMTCARPSITSTHTHMCVCVCVWSCLRDSQVADTHHWLLPPLQRREAHRHKRLLHPCTHTHTHTHRERERESERGPGWTPTHAHVPFAQRGGLTCASRSSSKWAVDSATVYSPPVSLHTVCRHQRINQWSVSASVHGVRVSTTPTPPHHTTYWLTHSLHLLTNLEDIHLGRESDDRHANARRLERLNGGRYQPARHGHVLVYTHCQDGCAMLCRMDGWMDGGREGWVDGAYPTLAYPASQVLRLP